MTDQEIIKAVECCSKYRSCRECSLLEKDMAPCLRILLINAKNLIVRQQAEIDGLKRLLEQEERSTNLFAKKCYKDGRKEFAEEIKCINGNEFIEDWIESGVTCYAFNHNKFDKKIDELVKGMEVEG